MEREEASHMTDLRLRLPVQAREGRMGLEAIRGHIRGMQSQHRRPRMRMAPLSTAVLRRVDNNPKTSVVGQPSMRRLATGSWERPLAQEAWVK